MRPASRPFLTPRPPLPVLAALFVAVLSLGLTHPLVVALFAEGRIVAGLGATAQSALLALALALLPFGVGLGAMWVGSSREGSRPGMLDRRTLLLAGAAGLAAGSALMWAGVHLNMIALVLAGRLVVGVAAGGVIAAAWPAVPLGGARDPAALWVASLFAPVAAVGFVCGPLLGGGLAQTDPETPNVAALCLALAAFIWLRRGTTEETPAVARPIATRASDAGAEGRRGRAPAAAFGAALFVQGLGIGLAFTFASIRIVGSFGLSTVALGLFGMVAALGAVVGAAVSGRIVGPSGRKPAGALVGALIALGLIVAASASPGAGLALQWPLAIAAGLAGGVSVAGTFRLLMRATGPGRVLPTPVFALAIGAFACTAAALAAVLLGRVPAEAMIGVAAGVDLVAISAARGGPQGGGDAPRRVRRLSR